MKQVFLKIMPRPALLLYHKFLSYLAAWWYRYPSKQLRVIGVTGTNGKSTTVNLIAKILEQAGYKVGLTSTVNIKIGKEDQLNNLKMTMPGRFWLQKILRRMVAAGCDYAIIESSSEGVLQYRNLNIFYDTLVFTNLSPEHLERHGGFENYKQAKLQYFRQLESTPVKIISGRQVSQTIIVNGDSDFAPEFLNFQVKNKYIFTTKPQLNITGPKTRVLLANNISLSEQGLRFKLDQTEFISQLKGRFNVENVLAAVTCAISEGVSLEVCRQAIFHVEFIPGRMELINAGQSFTVLIDYAPEPEALSALYEAIATWKKNRLIHVLGSAGGGRDRLRRAVLGQMAGERADIVIVTNEDPYDEDPREIMTAVAGGAESAGKKQGENLFEIEDRRQAIRFAVTQARPDDLVVITGKGSEQAIVAANNKKIPWDDRRVAREELERLGNKK